MRGDVLVVVAYNSIVASLLINAGLAKLTSPNALLRALQELFPAASITKAWAVRPFAVVELTAGLGLIALATVRAASLIAATLGVCFALLGAGGWLARSKVPCGCIGGYSDKPLGVTNVVVGLFLAFVLPLNTLIRLGPTQISDYSQWALVVTSVSCLLICAWMNRRLSWSLLRPAGAPASADGASR
jgi:hypothetical protein